MGIAPADSAVLPKELSVSFAEASVAAVVSITEIELAVKPAEPQEKADS